MDNEQPEIRYIIKRIKKKHNQHHGGSWKIAYADFVTAMMSFFLLMWLLSLLNKYQLDGISEYFRHPLKDAFTQNDNSKRKDLTKTFNHTDKPADSSTHAELGNEKIMQTLQDMRAKILKDLEKDPQMSQYKNLLNFEVSEDGLKIELRDLDKKSMFSQGKTDFAEHGKQILAWLSDELNHYPNRVMIIGHTDAVPYSGGENYGNWELSADRANATRRTLIKAGMDDQKIIRIVGVADTALYDKANAFDSINRRIEIVVLTDKASNKLLQE